MSATHLKSDPLRRTMSEKSGPKAAPRETKQNILLLADDLTGACDSGLEFLKAGRSVSVRFASPEAGLPPASADVTAISTATRNLTADEAEKRLLHLARIHRLSAPVLFQKVDSAGRGNAGAEMLAIVQASGCAAVVYAPAFPDAGRTVSQGLLRITDVCGQNQELALLSLIPNQARDRVRQIPVGSESALRQSMLQAHKQGKDIWLCDARQQQDLDQIARGASALPLRLLWTGSAGLARAVAKLTKAEAAAAIPAQC
ncbi:MAG: four-carbon acid sugar kinase family protein, partial [Terracidiphilus sp.]|nr:four-carbon acid sugar kinase family protein [Terracidiphilus sp.]